MDIKKDVRMHLNKLSKEVLGSSSKWQKTMLRGEVFNTEDGRRIMAYPTIEEVQASLEQRAKEMSEAAAAKAANPPPSEIVINVEEPERG